MKKNLQILFTFFIVLIKSQSPINSYIKETNFFPGSEPSGLIQFGDNLIFAANTTYGFEPHKYNLQTNSAEMIQNINNGFADSIIKKEFYKIGSSVYYFATDNSNLQLWSTNLTTNVTTKIKDLNIYYSNTNNIIAKVLNNKLYFVFQQKLYVSDGTATGTIQINNVTNVGNYIFENNGFVYFFGNNNNYGREIWKTDGSVAGTTVVKDINPGTASSIIFGNEKMYQFSNKIVFIAMDGNSNLGLWSTDGSSINTTSFYTLSNNSIFYDFDFQNYDKLLFTVNGNLWKTDGTSMGTNLIYTSIPPINKLTYYKNKIYIDTTSNLFYVNQYDQVNFLTNSVGTLFQTISPSNNGNYLALREYNNNSSPIYFFDNSNLLQTNIKFTNDTKFIEYQNRLIFSGYIESYQDFSTTYKNTELFSYDPLNNVSKIEKDLSNGSSGAPRNYTEINGEVYFQSRDGYYYQIYKLDSNNNVVKLSGNLADDFINDTVEFNSLIVSGNFIFFHNNKLYRTNIITHSSEQISPPVNEKIYGTYAVSNNKIIMKTFNNTDNYMRIWSLENSSTNFSLLLEKHVNNMPSLSNVDKDFVKTDSGIYFKMLNNSTTEIWKSDGTLNNTIEITDIGSIYAFKSFLGSLGNKVIYANNLSTGLQNSELYYINDSNNQNFLIKNNYRFIDGNSFVANNKLYFFTSNSNGFYTEIHSTDGTLQGSQLITTSFFTGENYITKCGNQNYFIGKSGGNQIHGIFKTDGTAAGTSLVIDGYQPGVIGQNFTSLNCLNNEIYAIDSMQRIFKTNGNVGNYQQVSFTIDNQLLQQPNYTWIKSLYIHNSKIYFSVDQYKNHGEELFITDTINTLSVSDDHVIGHDRILIYPNPVANEFNIKLNNGEKILKVLIYDANGRMISTHHNTLINVQNLSAGIYFLNVFTNLNSYNSKLIKK
ncbi:T9SS type A sorting domain-containing protein [Chryseobacterium sp. 09-1422]|uniref:T9SS type A sorting domain-containing protein n=1 Tax=Chryseobacterium kimseyorum TaxID=2984028 RepID=A0ABT3HVP5_9FLAO|nr:T9SS type A sorting domain-containing protein [Chryseobacterium kimseyorum]MCW3167867.1 T9SS type A sorting domain-containing protein [Chryseobacterium kimseyorum]